MTTKENIKAILSCNFSGFKDEHIETATNRIMETVNTTCPNCDSGYAQGYSDGYLKGKEERPHGKCENCYFRNFTEKFVDGVVEVMNKNGIASVEQLFEMLKGGEMNEQ